MHERSVQTLHNGYLPVSELVGILWVDGGEAAADHLVFHSVHFHGAVLVVDFLEQFAVLHLPVGVLLKQGGLDFELHHSDGLVHTSYT